MVFRWGMVLVFGTPPLLGEIGGVDSMGVGVKKVFIFQLVSKQTTHSTHL